MHNWSSGFQLALIKVSLLNPLVPALCPWWVVKYTPCTLLLKNADACLVVASLQEQEQL